MSVNNDGREVKSIWWQNDTGDATRTPKENEKMVFHSEYHGEYDIEWICVYDELNNEIERHNAKYISTINWK